MTLLELIFFLISVGLGILGASWAGRHIGWIGYPVGFVAGFIVLFMAVSLLMYLEQVIYRGRPWLPLCRKGKCRAADYRPCVEGDILVYTCNCGDRYVKSGRRVCQVMPDGSHSPYMIWRAFRGWFPDGG